VGGCCYTVVLAGGNFTFEWVILARAVVSLLLASASSNVMLLIIVVRLATANQLAAIAVARLTSAMDVSWCNSYAALALWYPAWLVVTCESW
jgi:hypothetical protein